MEIVFKNVSYIVKEPFPKIILGDINIEFKSGKINGITGPAGSGKSVLAQMINALMLPTKGSILIGDSEIYEGKISNIKNIRSKIGLVYQKPEEQFFLPTVLKEVSFGITDFKENKRQKENLQMVGLNETYLKRNPFTLSSGEKRKVAIASILIHDPEVIILDEPTIGLDNASKKNIIKTIKSLKTKYNKTVFVISKDTDLLLKICDYVVVLNKGQVVLEGNKYDVFTNKNLEDYGVKRPDIINFEMLALNKKKVKLGYRDEINDLMTDVYRYVKYFNNWKILSSKLKNTRFKSNI